MLECAPADLECVPAAASAFAASPTRSSPSARSRCARSVAAGGPIIGSHCCVYDGHLRPQAGRHEAAFRFAISASISSARRSSRSRSTTLPARPAWSAPGSRTMSAAPSIRSRSKGQIQGGFVQGLGYALSEEMVWDGGRLANPTMMDYKIPAAVDVPYEIAVQSSRIPSRPAPSAPKASAKAASSAWPPPSPTRSCNATGRRIRDLPLTPERVFER